MYTQGRVKLDKQENTEADQGDGSPVTGHAEGTAHRFDTGFCHARHNEIKRSHHERHACKARS